MLQTPSMSGSKQDMMREKTCRICMDDESNGPLISPCRCKGTMQYVHRECLDRWRLSDVNPKAMTECTTCRAPFNWVPRSAALREHSVESRVADLGANLFRVYVLLGSMALLLTIAILLRTGQLLPATYYAWQILLGVVHGVVQTGLVVTTLLANVMWNVPAILSALARMASPAMLYLCIHIACWAWYMACAGWVGLSLLVNVMLNALTVMVQLASRAMLYFGAYCVYASWAVMPPLCLPALWRGHQRSGLKEASVWRFRKLSSICRFRRSQDAP